MGIIYVNVYKLNDEYGESLFNVKCSQIYSRQCEDIARYTSNICECINDITMRVECACNSIHAE